VPHLEPFYADKLRGARGLADADAVLDLRQASAAQAQARIRDALAGAAPGRALAVRLAPPPEGGGETLFQPVGRQLLEARKAGLIERLETLPAEDGLGFFIGLAGRP
jgi:hypothetical protein